MESCKYFHLQPVSSNFGYLFSNFKFLQTAWILDLKYSNIAAQFGLRIKRMSSVGHLSFCLLARRREPSVGREMQAPCRPADASPLSAICLSVFLSVGRLTRAHCRPFIYFSDCLSDCLCLCRPADVSRLLAICLPVCLLVCLSLCQPADEKPLSAICLSVSLCACLPFV